jgi:SAM-dependent methyltransferase
LISVVIPFEPSTAGAAADLARALDGKAQVVLAGEGEPTLDASNGTQVLRGIPGKGRAIREALTKVKGAVTVIQDPDSSYPTATYDQLVAPIEADDADVVVGTRVARSHPLPERALGRIASLVTDTGVSDPLSGQKAFRTEALRSVTLSSVDETIDTEIVVKLAAQLYRFAEVPVEILSFRPRPLLGHLSRARALLKYATVQNDTDNQHEGYNTLARMEGGAPNYNRWIGQRFEPYLGRRVLEVGAGIGTITAQIEAGREKVIALEVDKFYVDRLKNRFRHKPHVQPYLADVALADWERLKKERLDSIVLSNVLEHIPDDGDAVRRFRQILEAGGADGRLVILVPAIPALFGSLDEAVGHHRRYTPQALRSVLEDNGFAVEKLEWMNVVGIPGWFLNGRVFKRRAMPPLQLRLYDQVAPLLAQAESMIPRLPIGMSLFAVARVAGENR